MAADNVREDWIGDFSILLRRDAIRELASNPDLEYFAGSKIIASLWLTAVSCMAGMLGGLLTSGALWSSFIYPPAWLIVVIAISFAIYWTTRKIISSSIGFLAGWCMFWGILTGAVAMWGAQLSTAGWAYGIAGGMGFLIGITGGLLEHADKKNRDRQFMTATVLAPASACLAAWLHRHGLIGSDGLQIAMWTGAIAAALFLGPVMTLYVATWNNARALFRLASLYLHHDDFIPESIRLLNIAIRLGPDDAALYDRRALAHALNGDMTSAEADWHQHSLLKTRSRAPHISRGWLQLRRGKPDLAATEFEKAMSGKARPVLAVVGRAICALRQDQPQQAVDLLDSLPGLEQDERSFTYSAQAHFMLGQWQEAISDANVAIDECDSIHGLPWLIRAEAYVNLGKRDEAIADFNRALQNDDELGINERAMEGLEKINGAVLEEDELENLEKRLNSN